MNSVLNFDQIVLNGYSYSDFNTIIRIPPELLSEERTYKIRIDDDTRIDLISLQEYNSNIYSDLILLINDNMSALDLPKSIDFLEERIEQDYEDLVNILQYVPDENEQIRIRDNISNKWYNKNEMYRNLLLVRPNFLAETIKVIKDVNSL